MAFSDQQVLQGRHLAASHGLSEKLRVKQVSGSIRDHAHTLATPTLDSMLSHLAVRIAHVDAMAATSSYDQRIAIDKVELKTGLAANGDLAWGGSVNYVAAAPNVRQGVESVDKYLKSAAEDRLGFTDNGAGAFTNSFGSTKHIAANDTYKAAIEKLDAVAGEVSASVTAVMLAANVSADTFKEVYDAYTAISGGLEIEVNNLQTNRDNLVSLSGRPLNSTDMGTFDGGAAGINFPDSSTLKAVLDSAEDLIGTNKSNINSNDADITDIRSAVGIVDGDANLGNFTGATIGANKTAKFALQALETKAELNATNIGGNDTDIAALQGRLDDAFEAEKVSASVWKLKFASGGPELKLTKTGGQFALELGVV